MKKILICFWAVFTTCICFSQVMGVQSYEGRCNLEGSHISEGPVSEDLSKYRTALRCDLMSISNFDSVGKHILIHFANKNSNIAPALGFAGYVEPKDSFMSVDRIYYGASKFEASEGGCKFFKKGNALTEVVCGGYFVIDSKKTVGVVSFSITKKSSEKIGITGAWYGYGKGAEGDEVFLTKDACLSPSGLPLDKMKKMYLYVNGREIDSGCFGVDNALIVGIWYGTKTKVTYSTKDFIFN